MDSKTIYYILIGIAAFSLLRIITKWRGFSLRRKHVDWDEYFIQSLRKAGVDTFADHVVDFFFTMPTRQGAEEVGRTLRADGYTVDIIEARETSGQFSLHASRRMRLIVADFQQLTLRFNQLAESQGGRYDNWAVVTKK